MIGNTVRILYTGKDLSDVDIYMLKVRVSDSIYE